MQKYFEKIIEQLSEIHTDYKCEENSGFVEMCIDAVKDVAEEYERDHIVDSCNQICDNADFLEYVKRYCRTRNLTVDEALQHAIVHEVAKQYKAEECKHEN